MAPVPIENKLNANPLIEMSCVSGRGQSAAYAAVQLAGDLHISSMAGSLEQEHIQAGLEMLLQDINFGLVHHEQLKFLLVVSEKWTILNRFLTGSQKIRCDIIEKTYSPSLDEWYASQKTVIWQE